MNQFQSADRGSNGHFSTLPGTAGLGPTHLYIRMIAVGLLLLMTGVAGGMVLERYVIQRGSERETAFPALEAVAAVIDENYYYRPTSQQEVEQLDRRMEQQAIIGALSSLDDDYTLYMTADQSATAQENLEGRYGGIGVDIAVKNDLVSVTNVLPESPADGAGILRGDVIEQVNGMAVNPTDLDGTVRLLRGDVGTVVDLSLIRASTGDRYAVRLTREEIVVPPVAFQMIEGTDIGWLRITVFGTDTVTGVDRSIAALEREGASAIVLDLRGNSGGWVDSAQEVLGRFLDPRVGPAMYEDLTPGWGNEEELPILRDGNSITTDLPIVVLVDAGTASAAEIVAGALKDYDRAIVVGEQTFGKGSVQRIFSFSDGSTLRVTVAEWFTPSKRRIQGQGIEPNIEVGVGGHATPGRDTVLDTAVKLLQSGDSRPTDLTDGLASRIPSPVASPSMTP